MNPKVFFLRNQHGHKVACVASTLHGEVVRFAVSTHNPIDSFDRNRAKQIAFDRLSSERFNTAVFQVPFGKNVKGRVLSAIAANSGLPNRTREAAQLWLNSHAA